MTLPDEVEERLVDIVRLQPTKNKKLQNRWDLESGSEVYRYLESELKGYYHRDDDSLAHAMAEAAEFVGIEPGVKGDDEAESVPSAIRVPLLKARVFEAIAGPDERSESVISVLSKFRDKFDVDPDVDDVRRAPQGLRHKGVIEAVYRAVPTFRFAVERDEVDVEAV